MLQNNYQEETFAEEDVMELIDDECHLILYNDDVNTFDFVIESLIKVCTRWNRQNNALCWFIIKANAR